jgi:hypothetical protein
MKKKHIKILIILGIVLLGAAYPLYDFYYPRIASRSGRVVDAVTGEPIPGAVVNYRWEFSGTCLTLGGGAFAADYEERTDPQGKYFIPAQRTKRGSIFNGSLMPESVLVYKDGYAAYNVSSPRAYGKPPAGRSFGYLGEDQLYLEKDNLVKLYPWKEGQSHEDHYQLLRTWLFTHRGKLLRSEMEKEKERAREEALAKHKRKTF